ALVEDLPHFSGLVFGSREGREARVLDRRVPDDEREVAGRARPLLAFGHEELAHHARVDRERAPAVVVAGLEKLPGVARRLLVEEELELAPLRRELLERRRDEHVEERGAEGRIEARRALRAREVALDQAALRRLEARRRICARRDRLELERLVGAGLC